MNWKESVKNSTQDEKNTTNMLTDWKESVKNSTQDEKNTTNMLTDELKGICKE